MLEEVSEKYNHQMTYKQDLTNGWEALELLTCP